MRVNMTFPFVAVWFIKFLILGDQYMVSFTLCYRPSNIKQNILKVNIKQTIKQKINIHNVVVYCTFSYVYNSNFIIGKGRRKEMTECNGNPKLMGKIEKTKCLQSENKDKPQLNKRTKVGTGI